MKPTEAAAAAAAAAATAAANAADVAISAANSIAKLSTDVAVAIERLGALQRTVAAIDDKVGVGALQTTVTKLEEKVDTISAEVKEMHAMANQWRGGIIVLIAVGGVMGFLASWWERLTK